MGIPNAGKKKKSPHQNKHEPHSKRVAGRGWKEKGKETKKKRVKEPSETLERPGGGGRTGEREERKTSLTGR